MNEEIKIIISKYIRIPAEQILPSTLIGRTAISNSILMHRMYAELSEKGFVVKDYWKLQNFSDLLQSLNPESNSKVQSLPVQNNSSEIVELQDQIGIDIEQIDALPRTNDFRENSFYTMNFSPAEISYCILKPDPYASFTGLFAAKEAIIKADDSYKELPFHQIEIQHTESGKPIFPGFYLSVSHAQNVAVAVALKKANVPLKVKSPSIIEKNNKMSFSFMLALIAFFMSFFALYFILKK